MLLKVLRVKQSHLSTFVCIEPGPLVAPDAISVVLLTSGPPLSSRTLQARDDVINRKTCSDDA